jgi:hypothetical protein
MDRRFAVVASLALLLTGLPLFAHGGHPHVMGTVVSFSGNTLVVKTAKGNTSLAVTVATKYYYGTDTSRPARPADVKTGMRVVVHVGSNGKAAEVHIPAQA